jgi:hypothetical protein
VTNIFCLRFMLQSDPNFTTQGFQLHRTQNSHPPQQYLWRFEVLTSLLCPHWVSVGLCLTKSIRGIKACRGYGRFQQLIIQVCPWGPLLYFFVEFLVPSPAWGVGSGLGVYAVFLWCIRFFLLFWWPGNCFMGNEVLLFFRCSAYGVSNY